MRSTRTVAFLSVLVGALLVYGCAGRAIEPTATQSERIVYGTDDRAEVYQAAPAAQAIASGSMVALVPKAWIPPADAPTLGTTQGLCPGERFADQPAAAFCTGVLVDWDLVLTAGHCVHLFALDDFVVVFDYLYTAPGVLAESHEMREPVAVVSEELDPEGVEPRLDYAWLRLGSPVASPRRPAAVSRPTLPIMLGEPLLSIGASGGAPLKVDEGGHMRDLHSPFLDYFIADTDTSEGGSGGGAFDAQGALLGILARGGTDYVATDAGCSATNRVPDGGAAQEQYTYASRAVEGLCSGGTSVSSICRTDCSDPCEALPAPTSVREAGGCRVAPAAPGRASLGLWASATALCLGLRVRRSRRRARSRNQREYFWIR